MDVKRWRYERDRHCSLATLDSFLFLNKEIISFFLNLLVFISICVNKTMEEWITNEENGIKNKKNWKSDIRNEKRFSFF